MALDSRGKRFAMLGLGGPLSGVVSAIAGGGFTIQDGHAFSHSIYYDLPAAVASTIRLWKSLDSSLTATLTEDLHLHS